MEVPSNQKQLTKGEARIISSDSPQLIKVMADKETNKRVMCHWISFFTIVIVFYILTFTVPEPLVEFTPSQPILNKETGQCPADYLKDEFLAQTCQVFNLKKNPIIGVEMFNMNTTNQFLVVQMNFTKNNHEGKKIIEKVDYLYTYYEIDEKQNIKKQYGKKEKHHFNVKCVEDQERNDMCQSRWILYVPEITFENILFAFEFLNPDQFINDGIELSATSFIYVNDDYTNYLLGVKYTFLFISIMAFIIYFIRLRKLAQQHWVLEQKFILALSATLVFFNDPIYANTILNPNMATAFFSVMFIVNFLVILFIFWIVALKRIVEDNARKNSKSFNKKLMLFGVLIWLFVLITYVGFSYEYQQHPGTEFYEEFSTFYEIIKYTGITFFSVYMLYIIFLYYKICQAYKTRIWRHRLFSVFSIYFIFCLAVFMFTGTPHVYSSYGERVLLFICIMNVYIYYMQFMYSPSDDGLKEAQQNLELDLPQQNQIYEMLDESIQIQEYNKDHEQFDQDQQMIQVDNRSSTSTQPQKQQQQQFQVDDDDDLEDNDDNQQHDQNGQSNIDKIYDDMNNNSQE